MPIYEFKCKKCGEEFEQILFTSDREEAVACPSCKSKQIRKLMSAFAGGKSGCGSCSATSCTSCAPS
ncbi:MAG TPA: zinc ribbon domain-containing protein [Syntrophales bacterium]|nr:zinc ribbon domain-containing protein [Syntrophales bacterium]